MSRWTMLVSLILLATAAAGPGADRAGAATGPVGTGLSDDREAGRGDAPPDDGQLAFVESVPLETDLDLPALPEAASVWPTMIAGARESLDLAAFYLSARPDRPGPLTPVLEALAAAAGRGVRLRVLSDAGFHRTYPEVAARLDSLPGAATRRLDARRLWGGVLHAKYLVVDRREFFLGSQNWDWRALAHIHELGVRVQAPRLARQLHRLLEWDWLLAGGETPAAGAAGPDTAACLLHTARGELVRARLAASPPQALPPGIPWDEPLLVAMIDGARDTLRLQLLTYAPVDREGRYYEVLENALRRAAARGVRVQILLANWAKRRSLLPYVRSLASVPGIEIRFSNIPVWSGGFVPYARVAHAKFLLADDDACWLGTANWARSYFHASRNVSLFLRGVGEGGCAAAAHEFFARGWHHRTTEPVSPGGEYRPPRIGK